MKKNSITSKKKSILNKKIPIRVLSKENIKEKKVKIINPINIKKASHRPTSALANQNMNNFSHLFKNNQNTNIDIIWTLNLRQSNDELDKNNIKFNKKMEKMNQTKEPSFYQEDLDKFIKKKMKKSKSQYDIDLPSLNYYSTYISKKKISDTHGTNLNNINLLNFYLTLRKMNFKHNKNDDNKSNKIPKWNNSVYKENSKDLITVNYNNNISSEKQRNWLNEKLVNRPYKVIFKKFKYDEKSNIIKRIYVKDKEKAYDKLGEIYSLSSYNDKYNEKNYNKIENLLNSNNKSQQNIWFQLSLRNNAKKNLSQKNIKH